MPHINKYRDDIDGLRGVAVVAVILNHLSKSIFTAGYLGVDVFFVISGYVITMSIMNSNHSNRHEFITTFFKKRTKRLLPALLFYIIVMAIIVSLVEPSVDDNFITAVFAVFGLSNLFFYSTTNNYFTDLPINNAFLHTWSLGVEEQFYLLFAVLIYTFYNKKYIKNNLIILLSISIIIFLILFILLHDGNKYYYLSPLRIWQFGFGINAYIFLSRTHISCKYNSIISNLALLILIVFLIIPPNIKISPIIIVILTTILLIFGRNNIVLNNKFIRYTGKISYSLYLWHWGVIYALTHIMPKATVYIYIISIPLMLTLAILSYNIVEKKYRYKNYKKSALTYITSVIIIILSLYTLKVNSYQIKTIPENISKRPPKNWSNNCVFNEAIPYAIKYDECIINNDSEKRRTIYAFGDSFIWSQYWMFNNEMYNKSEFNVISLSFAGTGPVPGINWTKSRIELDNYKWSTAWNEIKEKFKPGDVVYLSHRLSEYFDENKFDEKVLSDFVLGINQILSEIDNEVLVIVQEPLPFAKESECPPQFVYNAWYRVIDGCSISVSTKNDMNNRIKRVNEKLDEINKVNNNFKVLKTFNLHCYDDDCSLAFEDGEPIWLDVHGHPGVRVSELNGASLLELIRKYDLKNENIQGHKNP